MKITIPEPCHANWNSMSPTEKGRFCRSCEKTVFDFTQMGQDEIFSFFKAENTNGRKVCGHFKRSQLDSVKLQIPTSTLKFLPQQQVLFLSLLLSFGTMLFSCTTNDNRTVGEIELIDTLDQCNNELRGATLIIDQTAPDTLETTDSSIDLEKLKPQPLKGEVVEITGDVIAYNPEDIDSMNDVVDGNFMIIEDPSMPTHNEPPKCGVDSSAKK